MDLGTLGQLDVGALVQTGGLAGVLWFVLARLEKRVGRVELLLERLVTLAELATPSEAGRSRGIATPPGQPESDATRRVS